MQAGLVVLIAALLAAGILIFYLTKRKVIDRKLVQAETEAQKLLRQAQNDAEKLKKEKLVEAKEEIYTLKSEFDRQVREDKKELSTGERRLTQKEDNLDNRENVVLVKESDLERRWMRHRAR